MTNGPEHIGLYELNRRIRQHIHQGFPDPVWLVAEISDLSVNRNGHCYLELIEKEAGSDKILAKMRATIWSGTFRMLKPYFETTTGQALVAGISVLVRADLEFHELYSISLNIRDIEPSFTVGELARKRQMIIRKLEEAGVFDMNKGLEMPLVPQRIAIISSPTAAGYGDFVDQLLTNRYGFAFFPRLFPAVMQGESTGASIISALEAIETDGSSFDAVVIIRGGGSKLDLSSFDDFDLGMHVAQFNLPVITGIGHEQDDSIIDLVAHTRCKTPTAVAEFIIGRVSEFEARLDESVDSTIGIAEGFLSQARNTLTNIMEGMRLRVKGFTDYRKLELAQLASRTRQSVPVYFRLKGDALTSHEQTSELKNPINLLKMGYSITMVNGKPVKSTAGIRSGDELTTRLADGVVHSTATGSQIDNTKAKS